jgi:hypothetical protein
LVGYTATAADIGNCLNITGGTNFITGWYFITAQGGTTWTLDRNATSGAGAAMTGNMGGGWADFWTNNIRWRVAGLAPKGRFISAEATLFTGERSNSDNQSVARHRGYGHLRNN